MTHGSFVSVSMCAATRDSDLEYTCSTVTLCSYDTLLFSKHRHKLDRLSLYMRLINGTHVSDLRIGNVILREESVYI
jgi:hypothetical protein